jgi:hypothetical protein
MTDLTPTTPPLVELLPDRGLSLKLPAELNAFGLGSPESLLLQTHRRAIEAQIRQMNTQFFRMDAMQVANNLLAFFEETPLMTGISFWVGEEGDDLYFDIDHLEISTLGENDSPASNESTDLLIGHVGPIIEELFNDFSYTEFGLTLWSRGTPHAVDYTRDNLPGILEAAYDKVFGMGTWTLDRTSLAKASLTTILPEAHAAKGPSHRL